MCSLIAQNATPGPVGDLSKAFKTSQTAVRPRGRDYKRRVKKTSDLVYWKEARA